MYRNNYADNTVKNMNTKHHDLVQFKLDGMWVCVEIEGSWAVVRTRQGKIREKVRLLEPQPKSILVGEWMVGTTRAKKSGKRLVVFDCLEASGWSVEARTYLHRMLEAKRVTIPQNLSEVLGGVEYVETLNSSHALKMWNQVESGDEEGLILRRNVNSYGGTVTRVKPKVERDYFATIIHTSPEGKALSVGGSLTPGGEEVVRARLSPLADASAFHVGRVFKCQGGEVTARGSMRYPIFGGWHLEK